MKRINALSFFCLLFLFTRAQDNTGNRRLIDQATGNLLYIFQVTNTEGSQFLFDRWANARLVLDNNATINDVQVKFDIYNNKFIVNRRDTAFELTRAVREVRLYPTLDTSNALIFRKGFSINSNINNNTYVQVLAEGKVLFLKYEKKNWKKRRTMEMPQSKSVLRRLINTLFSQTVNTKRFLCPKARCKMH